MNRDILNFSINLLRINSINLKFKISKQIYNLYYLNKQIHNLKINNT